MLHFPHLLVTRTVRESQTRPDGVWGARAAEEAEPIRRSRQRRRVRRARRPRTRRLPVLWNGQLPGRKPRADERPEDPPDGKHGHAGRVIWAPLVWSSWSRDWIKMLWDAFFHTSVYPSQSKQHTLCLPSTSKTCKACGRFRPKTVKNRSSALMLIYGL